MYRKIFSQFDLTWLPITGLIIFLTCFILFLIWTFKKENKEFYENISQLPFHDGVKHE